MKRIILSMFLGLFLLFCAPSSADKTIEEARFHLDKGEFSQAIEKLEDLVAKDPNNNEAVFLLSSAYLGQAAQEPRSGCDEEETGLLGLLACFLATKDPDDRLGFRTFARIAPAEVDDVAVLDTGIDLLNGIENITSSNTFTQIDVFAQIAMSRMFKLSGITTAAQANTGNDADCNADLIDDDQAAGFKEDLDLIRQDLNNANFPSDFRLLTRAEAISDALEDAGFTTLTVGVQTIIADAFSNNNPPCTCTNCEQATLEAYNPNEID